jgi:mevalonate kinase
MTPPVNPAPSPKIKVSAPGKLILSGEHAVVYGHPALVASINQRLTLTLYPGQPKKGHLPQQILPHCPQDVRLHLNSEIPIGCGLGSSAALAVAFSAALLKYSQKSWNLKNINDLAYEIEKIQHQNPSGVDNTASTYGGFHWYRKETQDFKVFKKIKLKTILPDFFLLNSGTSQESTGQMVQYVSYHFKKHPRQYQNTFHQLEKITRDFLVSLFKKDPFSLIELINQNQKCLEKIGVVSPSAQKLAQKIRKSGGAAKISGAGGRKKGSGMLLVFHSDPEKLNHFVRQEKLDLIKITLGGKGVRL